MIASLVPLLLPLTAGLALQTPPSAAADARVHARASLPRVTVAVAVPLQQPTPAHALLAALISEPRALPTGEVAALRARSGALTARLLSGGLLVVAEADARDAPLAVAALRAALADASGNVPPLDDAGLPGAHARALVAAALGRADERAALHRAAASAWLGAGSPWGRAIFDDVTLLQTPLLAAASERVALPGGSAGWRWFVDGRAAPALLADLPAPTSPSPLATPTPLRTHAGVADTAAATTRAPSTAATLSQPLPLSATTRALAPALAAWIEEAGAEAGVQRAQVSSERGARLLVIELAPGADPTAVRAALAVARSKLQRTRDVERALVVGRAARARAAAAHGAWAIAAAEQALAGAPHLVDADDDADEDALLDLLRRVVLPEIMRTSAPTSPTAHALRRVSRSGL